MSACATDTADMLHSACRCNFVSAEVLREALIMLVNVAVSSADYNAATDPEVVSAAACARDLLTDASFYELVCVQRVFPSVLGELLNTAETSTLDACDGEARERSEQFVRDANAGTMAAVEVASHKPRPTPAAGQIVCAVAVQQASSGALRLVSLIGWMPAAYFDATARGHLLKRLKALEVTVFSALLVTSADCHAACCEAVCIIRATVSSLIADTALPAHAWSLESQLRWLLQSLSILAILPRTDNGERQIANAATRTGVLFRSLLQNGATPHLLSAVTSAVLSFCSNMPQLASSCSQPFERPAPELLPRTVVLKQQPRVPKVRKLRVCWSVCFLKPDVIACQALGSPSAHLLCRALVAHAVLDAFGEAAEASGSSSWHPLLSHVFGALQLLCGEGCAAAEDVPLLLPLFGASAAALQAVARAGSNDAASTVSTEKLQALLFRAVSLLTCSAAQPPVELLLFTVSALRLLHVRHELSDDLCRRLLSVFSLLLQGGVAVGDQLVHSTEALVIARNTLDAFVTLIDSPEPRQQQLVLDELLRAAHDFPSLADSEHWGAFGATLQLIAALTRALPKEASVSSGERILAAALAACTHASRADAIVCVSKLHTVAGEAVNTLAALLLSRSRYPLRATSVAQVVLVPSVLFEGCPQWSRALRNGSAPLFLACCDLLAVALRCRCGTAVGLLCCPV